MNTLGDLQVVGRRVPLDVRAHYTLKHGFQRITDAFRGAAGKIDPECHLNICRVARLDLHIESNVDSREAQGWDGGDGAVCACDLAPDLR